MTVITPTPCPFCAAPPEAPNAVQVVCRTPDCVVGGFWLPLDAWNIRASLAASTTVAPMGDDFPDLQFVSDHFLRGAGLG